MKTESFLKLYLLCFLCLVLTACPIVDGEVIGRFQKLFPMATYSHPTPDTLFLETNLTGAISQDLCKELFESFASKPEFTELKRGFDLAKYNWLCIGMADKVIAWDKNREQQFWILTRYQFSLPGWGDAIPPFTVGAARNQTKSDSNETSHLSDNPANSLDEILQPRALAPARISQDWIVGRLSDEAQGLLFQNSSTRFYVRHNAKYKKYLGCEQVRVYFNSYADGTKKVSRMECTK